MAGIEIESCTTYIFSDQQFVTFFYSKPVIRVQLKRKINEFIYVLIILLSNVSGFICTFFAIRKKLKYNTLYVRFVNKVTPKNIHLLTLSILTLSILWGQAWKGLWV